MVNGRKFLMEREEIKLFFNKNKRKMNLEEEKDVCVKEPEDVSLKHRLNCLMNMSMLGAASIMEIKAIQNRLDELNEEEDYSKWFKNNKSIIEDLFQSMKVHFLTIGEIYELPQDAEEGVFNQALMRVQVNDEAVNKEIFITVFSSMIDKFSKIYSKNSHLNDSCLLYFTIFSIFCF